MKRIISIVLLVTAVLLLGVGIVAADPGPHNPYRDVIVNVDCEGTAHDYEMLYTVGLSPWFDPNGSAVATGPTRVEVENRNGQWELRFAMPDQQQVPTIYCEWTRGDTNYRGDIQFAPPH